MAEKAIDQRRKSQLFLHNIAPVTVTYDEFVRRKLKPGKYLSTVTGIIKMIGMLIILLGIFLFEAESKCQDVSGWYPYLFPISLGITLTIQLVLFLIFSFGLAMKRPGLWIYMDMVVILLLSINSLICSIVTDKDCPKPSILIKVCTPLSMVGSGILIISCGSIFLMYRFNEEVLEREENHIQFQPDPKENSQPRKSIFA